MKENIRVIFTYIATNFLIKSNSDKTFEFSKFEYESNIRPVLNYYMYTICKHICFTYILGDILMGQSKVCLLSDNWLASHSTGLLGSC